MPNNNMQDLADEGIYGGQAQAINDSSEQGGESQGSPYGPGTLPDGRMEGINPQMDPREEARSMAYTMMLQQILGADRNEVQTLIEAMGGYGPVSELLQGGRPEEINKNLQLMREWLKQMRGSSGMADVPEQASM